MSFMNRVGVKQLWEQCMALHKQGGGELHIYIPTKMHRHDIENAEVSTMCSILEESGVTVAFCTHAVGLAWFPRNSQEHERDKNLFRHLTKLWERSKSDLLREFINLIFQAQDEEGLAWGAITLYQCSDTISSIAVNIACVMRGLSMQGISSSWNHNQHTLSIHGTTTKVDQNISSESQEPNKSSAISFLVVDDFKDRIHPNTQEYLKSKHDELIKTMKYQDRT